MNKILIKGYIIVFDGEMQLEEEYDPQTYKLKFNFSNNCIFPYEEILFISNNIQFNDETGNEKVNFSTAFDLQCELFTLVFTSSDQFSNNFDFTKSQQFSNSFDFTESQQFSNSFDFTKSQRFSNSLEFTTSKEFTISNALSQSNTII